MTTADLITAGEAIARPAYVLGTEPTDSGMVAYWGGIRVDQPNTVPPSATALRGRRHICTIGETLLSRLDMPFVHPTGPISLFEINYADGRSVSQADGDYRRNFAALEFADGAPLYATAIHSFPPFAALCLYGGERIGTSLAEQGLARHDYWRADTEANTEYDEEWQRRSPFYDSAAAVVVGGWHFLWPEDDFYTPPECRLLFMTQRKAEPWYEVWRGAASGGLTVKERIT